MSLFHKVKNTLHLFRAIDINKLSAISEKIDLAEAMDSLGELDEKELKAVMKLLQSKGKKGQHKLPPIDADFYNLEHKLSQDQYDLQLKVRNFMEDEIRPLANKSWYNGEFPFEVIEKFKKLGLAGMTYEGYGCPHLSNVMEGVLTQEMARVDASVTTFFGAHSGLAMGSIYLLGSDSQKEEWLPQMQKLDKIGAFGLTEPEIGSAISQGMKTTCKLDGENWILNGEKKWIGNATFADVTVIWAKDTETQKVKGFLVRK